MKHIPRSAAFMSALLMSTLSPVLASMAAPAALPAAEVAAAQETVTAKGEWMFTFDTRNQAMFRGAIDQNGTKLTGYMGDESAEYPLTGTIDGTSVKISWAIEQAGQKVVFTITGKLDKESINGRATVGTLAEVDVTGIRTAK